MPSLYTQDQMRDTSNIGQQNLKQSWRQSMFLSEYEESMLFKVAWDTLLSNL